MNRQQLKDVLEVIGFLAIIGSLYFVGVETRNGAQQTALNTQAVEISAYQALTANILEANAIAISDEHAAAILREMRDGSPDQTRSTRIQSAFFMQFRHGDIAYFMHQQGAIDEDRLRSTLRPLPLAGPTGLKFWNDNKFVFVEGYQQYIDALIEEGFFIQRPTL